MIPDPVIVIVGGVVTAAMVAAIITLTLSRQPSTSRVTTGFIETLARQDRAWSIRMRYLYESERRRREADRRKGLLRMRAAKARRGDR